MAHPNSIPYCVHKYDRSGLNGVTIREGPRVQRFELASPLRYFSCLVCFCFLMFTLFYFLRKRSLCMTIIEFANIKNSGREYRVAHKSLVTRCLNMPLVTSEPLCIVHYSYGIRSVGIIGVDNCTVYTKNWHREKNLVVSSSWLTVSPHIEQRCVCTHFILWRGINGMYFM